ncbi:ABC transporter permease [Massilia sp. S19_KUP03_FR1]|uniref:ABC transporter permease n=1 Tax=Massilia sp. S19_KUP03_FR1 TaxID=3025503 RepID=UPI002FCD9F60
MFAYYFKLGVRSLRRNPALTTLMILTLAVGVAASIATLTILHAMSSNPIPQKSTRLFAPLIDNGPLEGYNPNDPRNGNDLISYIDAMNLLASAPAERKAALYGISGAIEPARRDMAVMSVGGIGTSRDFFGMLDVPFLYGQAWSEADDKAGTDVVVISRALSEKLFGTASPVGQRMRMNGFNYQITGVTNNFKLLPKFYRLVGGPGAFGEEEEIMVPLSNAVRHELPGQDSMSCSSNREAGFQGLLKSECTWMQVWLETRTSGERIGLQDWLDSYATQQRKLGRLMRKANNQLFDVEQWLEYKKVVENDSRLAVYLAFGFLLLCLVNTVGLLLAKFSVRAAEVGIRRALGASRRAIFQQFLIETAVVGLAGAALGLLLSFAALALIGMQSKEIKTVAHLDWQMLVMTVLLSLAASLLAGLLPTWRACQVTPAIQLKSQ